jgi:MGT family glycosyltransferase
MRVLLMSSAEKGHLNPLVGVAQHCLADGHEVGWLTLPEPAEQLDGLGVEVLGLRRGGPPPPLVTGGEALARLVLDRDALRRWIRMLLLDAVPDQLEPVREVMRAFRPDVVAIDGMLYQGVIAAHLEGIPYAGVSSALTLLAPQDLAIDLLDTVRGLAQERAALFARYGLRPEFRTCECLSPSLNVVFATAALVGDDAPVPPRTRLVGPSRPRARRGDEPGFPWHRLDGRPLVYVSFGSQISWQPELFQAIAQAAAPLDAQLVLSAGALAETDFARALPGGPLLVGYAPQLQLLERAATLVSHGGANSVMEAMDHGVPALLVPICNDQPVQAHFLARAGAGTSLARADASVENLRRALLQLLDAEGAARRNARRVRDSYRAHDGAREAARLIAGVAATT